MTNFTILHREYVQLPRLLMEQAPGFAHSDEYMRLDESDLDLPSIVCGAFSRYLCRLQNTAEIVPPDPSRTRHLSEVYRTIERLSQSDDPEVVNTVVVEIFEHLDLTPSALDAFKSQLGMASRALYDEWIVEAAP